ncbi:hypothetical protein Agabi119p4_11214 [Agaricus bisporus var. burnettii]|uniref:Uncharacterized protein n=1 Tax=Agaricus bisporus var. burnettii TaxID=192524 RepID=A0A8H7EVV3_AGABI|nr:hypothetical protein Agabi119p4_11214 [Agaricus bisporus var. burnettii]
MRFQLAVFVVSLIGAALATPVPVDNDASLARDLPKGVAWKRDLPHGRCVEAGSTTWPGLVKQTFYDSANGHFLFGKQIQVALATIKWRMTVPDYYIARILPLGPRC